MTSSLTSTLHSVCRQKHVLKSHQIAHLDAASFLSRDPEGEMKGSLTRGDMFRASKPLETERRGTGPPSRTSSIDCRARDGTEGGWRGVSVRLCVCVIKEKVCLYLHTFGMCVLPLDGLAVGVRQEIWGNEQGERQEQNLDMNKESRRSSDQLQLQTKRKWNFWHNLHIFLHKLSSQLLIKTWMLFTAVNRGGSDLLIILYILFGCCRLRSLRRSSVVWTHVKLCSIPHQEAGPSVRCFAGAVRKESLEPAQLLQ